MKYLVLMLTLIGCAHTTAMTQAESHRKMVFDKAVAEINSALVKNPLNYGSMVPGSRFIELVDMAMDSNGESGVAVIEARGENRESIGRIYIYIFCDPTGSCRPVQVGTKVLAPLPTASQSNAESQRL